MPNFTAIQQGWATIITGAGMPSQEANAIISAILGVNAEAVISGNVTITGGTIDGTVIGGTTRAAGAFTTLGANSTTTFADGATWSTTGLTDNASYITTSTSVIQLGATQSFSSTGNVSLFNINATPTPTGLTSNATRVLNLQPTLGTSSTTITEYSVAASQVRTAAGYTGQISQAVGLNILSPSISGSLPPSNYFGLFVNASAVGNGITSGTVNNYLVVTNPSTAAAAAGGTVNNTGGRFNVGTGSGAGTTNNYGLYITGNGGSGGGGTTTNYALYSDSTAAIYHASTAVRWAGYGAGALTTDSSGNITATSDESAKDIVGHFTAGLSDLREVQPICYRWNKASGMETKDIYAGFGARNVNAAIPLATGRMPDGKMTLQDRALLAAVVNAVKELDARTAHLSMKQAA